MSQDTPGTPSKRKAPTPKTPDAAVPTTEATPAAVETPAAAATPEPVAAPEPVATPEPVASAEQRFEAGEATESFVAYEIPAGTVVVTGSSLLARLGAEVFGTFFLVLAGLGIAVYGTINSYGPLPVALGFGIALLAGAIAVGNVSGAHFNPAVTFGAAIAGRTAWRDVLPYWLAQLVGGALAAAVVFITIPSALPGLIAAEGNAKTFFSALSNGYGPHSPLSTASQGQVEFGLVTALLIEVVVTAVFMGVILASTDRRAAHVQAPFAIGLALTILILVAMPITNASLNPARSTASAIFSESWAFGQLWVFWVAPLAGAALAALVYRAFAAEPPADNLLEEDEAFVVDEDVVVVEGDARA